MARDATVNAAATSIAPMTRPGPGAPALEGDLRFQVDHVARAAWRLIALQDKDPNSPSHGCFHAAYWRDKTSEFPDARFQEAGAALGLLAIPDFDFARASEPGPTSQELTDAFLAGAANLARQQYAEGSYDEWYKGERGFAATAFTTAAYGCAALHLDERMPLEARDALLATLTRAADWLVRRDDIVKINHEIVAAAALAVVWKLTGEHRYLDAARRKFAVSLTHRDPEGWFRELAGCDLGYSHLVLDYIALYPSLTGDEDAAPAAGALLNFLVPHLHPDLTAAAEAGTCRNPYVGQLGFVAFEIRDPKAAAICAALRGAANNPRRLAPYLADDLRLARWAILPLLAALLARGMPAPERAAPLAEIFPQGWTVNPNACLAAFHEGDFHVYAPVAGGAVTRVFQKDRCLVEDLGVDILGDDGAAYTTRFYDASRSIRRGEDGLSVEFALARASYFFPTFAQRLVLRLGSASGPTSRLTRAMIDRYRTAKNTAINQSAASVGAASGRWSLKRTISFTEKEARIVDVLRDRAGRLSSEVVRASLKIDGERIDPMSHAFSGAAEVRLEKTIRLDGEGAVDIRLDHA